MAALALLFCGRVSGVSPMNDDPFASETGCSIQADALFDQLPDAGFIPVRVKLKNGFAAAAEWELDFGAGWRPTQMARFRTGKIAPGDTWRQTLLVPLDATQAGSGQALTLRLQGPGTNDRPMTSGFASLGAPSGGSPNPFFLMDTTLATNSLGLIEAAATAAGNSLRGTRIDHADLPSDPIAYRGVASLWILQSSFEALREEQRNAVLGWVATGGHLFLAAPRSERSPTLEARYFGTNRPRFGAMEWIDLEGGKVSPSQFLETVKKTVPGMTGAGTNEFSSAKGLLEGMDPLQLHSRTIIGFLLLFAVVVGPLNFLFVTRKRRRHLLFLTTPLLSLAASAIILGLIYLQDGTGGEGNRVALLHVLPGRNELHVVQEQITKTGFLLQTDYTQSEPAYSQYCQAFLLDPRENTGGQNPDARWIEGERRWGAWLSSRSAQGQYLETFRPSRAEILVRRRADGTPEALSSFPGTLKVFSCIDAQGKLWEAKGVETGRPTPLVQAQAPSQAISQAHAAAGPGITRQLAQVAGARGVYVAMASGGKGDFIETAPFIRWKTERVIILGETGL